MGSVRSLENAATSTRKINLLASTSFPCLLHPINREHLFRNRFVIGKIISPRLAQLKLRLAVAAKRNRKIFLLFSQKINNIYSLLSPVPAPH